MTQSEWIYAILQEHGFEACVEAFKQNIQELRRDKKLEEQKRLCLQKLSVTTADRDGYIQAEISKYEKCMRDSISQASDTGLCSVYNVISIVWNYVLSEAIIAELKQQAVKLSILPDELNNDEAKSIISKAIAKGLCDNNNCWLKTKALLAYFADRARDHLNLGQGEYDGSTKTSWKPFESLFGVNGLSGAKRDYQKTGTLPNGHNIVDELFK